MVKELKFIYKGQEKIVLLDDQDYDDILLLGWHFNIYDKGINQLYVKLRWRENNKERAIDLHRFVMKEEIIKNPKMHVDHINFNNLDCRRDNLRLVTRQQNQMHHKPHKKNADINSKYKGVTFDEDRNLWHAQIKFNGVYKFIGRYKLEESAAEAYNRYASKHYSEFAYLNEIDYSEPGLKEVVKKEVDDVLYNLEHPVPTSSKYKGVTLLKGTKKWCAQIRLNGTMKHLGTYANELDAAKAFNVACIFYYGPNDPRINILPEGELNV